MLQNSRTKCSVTSLRRVFFLSKTLEALLMSVTYVSKYDEFLNFWKRPGRDECVVNDV